MWTAAKTIPAIWNTETCIMKSGEGRKFEVLALVPGSRKHTVVVFARLLTAGEWPLTGPLRLGGVEVMPSPAQPRTSSADVYAFTLLDSRESDRLVVGQRVELEV
jgi:hypothetical protein